MLLLLPFKLLKLIEGTSESVLFSGCLGLKLPILLPKLGKLGLNLGEAGILFIFSSMIDGLELKMDASEPASLE